jgi:hypothetical protein
MLVRELFRYIDKEPQEVTKAWSLLTQHHRALLTCLMDMLTEPEHFLQSADMISLVYPESLDTEKEWVRRYAVFPIAARVAAFASSFPLPTPAVGSRRLGATAYTPRRGRSSRRYAFG